MQRAPWRLGVFLLLLFLALVILTVYQRNDIWRYTVPTAVSWKVQPGNQASRIFVVAGLMATDKVPSELLNAIHHNVLDFNDANHAVFVQLCIFVGREGHPMLHQLLAQEAGVPFPRHNTTLRQMARLPLIVRGNFVENMDNGKTLAWYLYATSAYPSCNWILKMDIDTSVNWYSMIPWLSSTHDSLQYIGLVNDWVRCGQGVVCPPRGCTNMAGDCWIYMSGGLYGASLPLAQLISRCSYYREHAVGYEDLQFGLAVKHCSAGQGNISLVNVPLGMSWCHSKRLNLTHMRNGWLLTAGNCV